MSVFQPQVEQLNSSATATAGVDDVASVNLFADVASNATSAGFSLAGKAHLEKMEQDVKGIVGERSAELSGLQGKLNNISQVMASGKDSAGLQVKARAALDKTKAEAPWVSKQADELYNRLIGAGRGGAGATSGVFAPSAEEKVAAEFQQEVAEKQVTSGLSQANAAERVRMDRQRADAKKEFEFMSARGKIEGDAVNTYVNSTLATSTVRLMDTLVSARSQGNGSIDAKDIPSLERAVDRQAAVLLQDALGGLTDAAGNPVTNPPDKATVDAIQSDINDWVVKSKAMITNSGTTKLISELNLQSTAREQQIIHANFGVIDIANAKGGQAYVQDFINWAGQEPGAIQGWFKKQNPELMKLLGTNSNIPALLGNSYNKLIGIGSTKAAPVGEPKTKSPFITEEEALVIGTAFNDPTVPASLLYTVFDRTVEEVESKENLKKMLLKNEDSFAMFYGDKYKNYLVAQESNALSVADTALSAAKEAYNTQSFSQSQSFTPKPFEIKLVTPEGKFGVPRVTAVGEGITTEMAGVIDRTYRMFKANPKVLSDFITKQGMDVNSTPEMATQMALLGEGGVRDDVTIDTNASKDVPLDDTAVMGDTNMRKGLEFLLAPGSKWSSDLKGKAQETLRLMESEELSMGKQKP